MNYLKQWVQSISFLKGISNLDFSLQRMIYLELNLMNKTLFLLLAASLIGCAAHPLSDGAEAVRILDSEPDNCTFVGEVAGSQGNWLTADYTSDKNILVGARNQAKNQAVVIGANVIVIKKNVDNSNGGLNGYGDNSGFGISSTKGTYSSTIIGDAFKCTGIK